MTELDDLRQRVDRLESRAEIGELVSEYAIACDDHDMPRLMSLFTANACLTSPSGLMQAEGRDAVRDLFIRLFQIRGPAFHWTHDHIVRFTANPDEATGLVLAHAETTPHLEVSLAAMRYEDVYRREAGRWLFASRRIGFLYYIPARDAETALASPNRITVSGQRLPADFPETLASWQDFLRVHGGPTPKPEDTP